jgi:DNA-binding transcriptional regulator YiaG
MPIDQQCHRKMIKDVRLQLGLSQDELARALGMSFASVNRWENGKTIPSQLAWAQFNAFCREMETQGKLKTREGAA